MMSLSTLGVIMLITSFVAAYVALLVMMPRFTRAGIVGRDMHKPDQRQLPEMGGVALVVGFGAAILLLVGVDSFFELTLDVNLSVLLGVLVTVLVIALIGIFDDLVSVGQAFKTLIPLVAALPLMALRTGHTVINLPFLGMTDVGLLYPLVFVPIGVTGAANAVNMLAGWNGSELGMGAVAFVSLLLIALSQGEWHAALILVAALGATLACLRFNWYPAKIFIGDAGTLAMGAILASAVIVGNMEKAGVILVIPHFVDFVLKARNRFPKSFGELRKDGKLYCPAGGPVGLGQLIMKWSGGISERNLTLILIGLQALMGLIAVLLYV